MTKTLPFGTPTISARPIVTTVPTLECAGPSRLYRRLRTLTGLPSCLLESSDSNSREAQRSVIGVRCPLRVEIRGAVVSVQLLDSTARSTLEAMARRLPGGKLKPDGIVYEIETVDASTRRGSVLDDATRIRSAGVLDVLRAAAGLVGDAFEGAPIATGLFGALGYEIVDQFESLPDRRPDPLGEPDASFLLATDQILFDHEAGVAHVITRQLGEEDATGARRRHSRYLALLAPGDLPIDASTRRAVSRAARDRGADVSDAQFLAGVESLQREILAGEIFQAVLSRGFEVESDVDSLDVYAELRRSNPSPYMFHVDLADGCLLGASPETFLRCENGKVEVRPIAGTVPRGGDEEADQRLALQLLLDPKEQAEHAMLLDLARNDVARCSEPGTCEVVQQFEVEKYSHVQHIVSRVRGTLSRDLDALHAYRSAANMGTLTGAPKLRAMELIRGVEPTARGFYGGALGYLLQDGTFDSCIVIRSLRHLGGVYRTRAGAGIVLDSDPRRELRETRHKSRACVEAVLRATERNLEELAS